MAGQALWDLFFTTFTQIYEWMVSTPAVSYVDDFGVKHTISFFAVSISYLIVQAILAVILFFSEYFNPNNDDDGD